MSITETVEYVLACAYPRQVTYPTYFKELLDTGLRTRRAGFKTHPLRRRFRFPPIGTFQKKEPEDIVPFKFPHAHFYHTGSQTSALLNYDHRRGKIKVLRKSDGLLFEGRLHMILDAVVVFATGQPGGRLSCVPFRRSRDPRPSISSSAGVVMAMCMEAPTLISSRTRDLHDEIQADRRFSLKKASSTGCLARYIYVRGSGG